MNTDFGKRVRLQTILDENSFVFPDSCSMHVFGVNGTEHPFKTDKKARKQKRYVNDAIWMYSHVLDDLENEEHRFFLTLPLLGEYERGLTNNDFNLKKFSKQMGGLTKNRLSLARKIRVKEKLQRKLVDEAELNGTVIQFTDEEIKDYDEIIRHLPSFQEHYGLSDVDVDLLTTVLLLSKHREEKVAVLSNDLGIARGLKGYFSSSDNGFKQKPSFYRRDKRSSFSRLIY